ncbi:hypothetical protein CY34DRAFT_799558 [Suillus luteus UH-Slu-Lm8-n1]|uniref:Uncharacterized protein n=1 Tax=Suillus luteus UH-Slu-Lm8-n1 TaxID=930992 RepID=A0A0D0BBS6_9AGAM|nr:hypothetical protein CY34DRAFT_799558 [Suillus luteus UH-Slu-Lm8-n1]
MRDIICRYFSGTSENAIEDMTGLADDSSNYMTLSTTRDDDSAHGQGSWRHSEYIRSSSVKLSCSGITLPLNETHGHLTLVSLPYTQASPTFYI